MATPAIATSDVLIGLSLIHRAAANHPRVIGRLRLARVWCCSDSCTDNPHSGQCINPALRLTTAARDCRAVMVDRVHRR
jgi:hypothetical protein